MQRYAIFVIFVLKNVKEVAGRQGDTEALNLEFGAWNLFFCLLSSDFSIKFFPKFVNPLTTTPALWITKFCN